MQKKVKVISQQFFYLMH